MLTITPNDVWSLTVDAMPVERQIAGFWFIEEQPVSVVELRGMRLQILDWVNDRNVEVLNLATLEIEWLVLPHPWQRR